MAIVLSDRAEQEILEEAYAGESVIVGLYYETGGRLDSENDSNKNYATTDDGAPNDRWGTTLSERAKLSRIEETEPDGSAYQRQTATVSQANIRRDPGFSSSTDLSSKISLPPVSFDVSDSTLPVNAVFVIYDKTGDVHFNTFLDQTYQLQNYDGEVTISNVELIIE